MRSGFVVFIIYESERRHDLCRTRIRASDIGVVLHDDLPRIAVYDAVGFNLDIFMRHPAAVRPSRYLRQTWIAPKKKKTERQY